MLVSIVMGVYNGEKYLAQQLDSLLGQSYCDIEIVASDDASTDNSFNILEGYAAIDKRVRLVRNVRTLGIKANFLNGLKQAHGDLICFSDQDDIWKRDKIKTLSELLAKEPQSMLAYSDLEVCDADLRPLEVSFWGALGVKPLTGRLAERSFIKIFVPGCTMMFRRKVADGVNRVHADESFLHDHLALVVASGMGKVVYSPEKLVHYRQHSANLIGVSNRSDFDGQIFSEDLGRKVRCVREADIKDLHLNFEKLENFAQAYLHDRSLERMRYMNYFLYLRRETLGEKMKGLLECFCPKIYRKLRRSR